MTARRITRALEWLERIGDRIEDPERFSARAIHVLIALWIASGIVAAVVLFVLDYQMRLPRWHAYMFAAAGFFLGMAMYRLKDW